MRIERISENQIRCTLTKSDLEEHELLLNDLAFGGDRAKELFRDLMAQASDELGFEADNIPLMIEAVPVSSEKIVLIITKMDSPEELDDRFSKYIKPLEGILSFGKEEDDEEDSENIIDFTDDDEPEKEEKSDGFSSLSQIFKEARKMAKEKAEKASDESLAIKRFDSADCRIYRFSSLIPVIEACKKLSPIYNEKNTLYKDPEENFYYLLLTCGDGQNPIEFFSMCDLLSEYGVKIPASYGTHAYFEEHFSKVIESNAVDTLASL